VGYSSRMLERRFLEELLGIARLRRNEELVMEAVEAHVSRMKDSEAGETQVVRVPSSDKHQGHTRLFERHALEMGAFGRTFDQARQHSGSPGRC
jgi:hypothetical protein